MADSGTFTDDALSNRRRIADQLLMQSVKPREIRHWAQGLGQLGEAALAGVMGGLAEREQKDNEKAQTDALARMLGGGGLTAVEKPAAPPAGAMPPFVPTQDAGTTPDYSKAIASIESGGAYDKLGPVTKGDRAYGKYQVMGANVPVWTKAHLGQEMTPQQFLTSPEAQEAVFKGQFGQYAQKYGPEGAAKAWFAGERGMNNPNARDILGTTVQAYGDKFTKALGSNPVAAALAAPQQTAQAAPAQIPQPGGDLRAQIAQMLNNPNPAVQRQGRALATTIVQKQLEGEKPTDDIRDYEYAKRQGFKGTLQDWITTKRAGAGEYGLNPVWGVGPDGKPAIAQLGKGGKAIQAGLPEGFQIAKDPIKIDAGTHFILLDPQTRQPIGQISKNIVEAKSQGEQGEAQGKAKVALPAAENTTKRALTMLDQLEQHPGLSEGVGFIVGRLPALTPKAADFRERVEQIDAMVFGDAVEVMRGLGALTDREGPKVTAARARLKTAKSEEDFRTALKDIREVFQTGIENMRTKAGAGTAPGAAAPSAPTGAAPNIDDLVKKYSK